MDDQHLDPPNAAYPLLVLLNGAAHADVATTKLGMPHVDFYVAQDEEALIHAVVHVLRVHDADVILGYDV